jgi:general secretion pathway protein A
MFLGFYGLREQPFGVTPNPRFIYLSPVHHEVLNSLVHSIEFDLGFAALTAEPGLGKTTLLFTLLEKYRATARTAVLFTTQCDSLDLLRYVAADLDLPAPAADPVLLHRQIRDVLVREARNGRRVLVIIDEAHNLADPVLETVRLLSDFETPQLKLLNIILAGQLELAQRLAQPNLKQLAQRIAVMNRLVPLTAEETRHYVEHRLQVAGYSGNGLFSPDALEAILHHSDGVPRNINRICFQALLQGAKLGARTIDACIVRQVTAESDLSEIAATRPSRPVAHQAPMLTPQDVHASSVMAGGAQDGTPDENPGTLLSRLRLIAASRATIKTATTAAADNIIRAPGQVAASRADLPPPATSLPQVVTAPPEVGCALSQSAPLPLPRVAPTGTAALLPPARAQIAMPASAISPAAKLRTWLAPSARQIPQRTRALLGYGHAVIILSLAAVLLKIPKRTRALLRYGHAVILSLAAVLLKLPQRTRPLLRYGLAVIVLSLAAVLLIRNPLSVGQSARPQAATKQQVVQAPIAPQGVRVEASPTLPTLERPNTAASRTPPLRLRRLSAIITAGAANKTLRRPASGVATPVLAFSAADGRVRDIVASAAPPPPVLALPRTTGGKLIKRVKPAYSTPAKIARVEGEVVLNATVLADGKVGEVSIINGNPLLARSAVEAVKRWRYEPYRVGGNPVSTDKIIRIKFRLVDFSSTPSSE